MKYFFLIIISLFFFFQLFNICLGGEVTVTISENVETSSDYILLGDIAFLKGDPQVVSELSGLEIRKTPGVGYSVNISRTQIEYLLKQKGFDVSCFNLEIPDNFKVIRSSQELKGNQIIEKAVSFFKENMPWKEEEVLINNLSSVNDVIIPTGDVKLIPFFPYSKKFIGNVAIPVEILINDICFKKVSINFEVKVSIDVIVAKRDIKREEIITLEVVQIEKRELNQYNPDFFTSSDQIVGMMASKNIDCGKIISQKSLQIPIMVKYGDLVNIVLKNGQIEVSAAGKARESGRFGDIITVINIDSGKELAGKIIDNGTVLIELK